MSNMYLCLSADTGGKNESEEKKCVFNGKYMFMCVCEYVCILLVFVILLGKLKLFVFNNWLSIA